MKARNLQCDSALLGAAFIALPLFVLIAERATPHAAATGAALGREVYIAEGCIHCHSQYVRPDSLDAQLWGEPRDPEFSREQSPALIGNRRQGPDLINVGARRTPGWQREHLIDPRAIMPTSRMPAYAHLFAPGDARGPALVDYLDTLGRETGGEESANLQAPRESGVAEERGAAQIAAGYPR